MQKPLNEMTLVFLSRSANESFSRSAAAAFFSQLDPTVEELADIKTAVSEAVTNCIVHAYRKTLGKIKMTARIYEGGQVYIQIKDAGCGIPDVKQAMEPLFTTKPDLDRSGMGFSFMEAFMDRLEVVSTPGEGTVVKMEKTIGKGRRLWTAQPL